VTAPFSQGPHGQTSSPPAHAVLLSYPEPKSTQQILFLFMDDF
jgi:hypothetical protein